MNISKSAFLIIATLSLSACEEQSDRIESQKDYFKRVVNEDMVYAKDARTEICFARPLYSFRMLAAVPCTERVLAEIEKGSDS